MNELEEGRTLRLDFAKLLKATGAAPDIVPVAVQNIDTGEVILVAYANERALRAAIATRSAVFWSTSRNELWVKGETSGHHQHVREILVDCDADAVVLKIDQLADVACHLGYRSCFFRRVDRDRWTTIAEPLEPSRD